MAEQSSITSSIVETVKTIVYALLIAGVFRSVFYQPFWIPSGSMKETLLIGDFLFVNKMAYGYSYASCPSIPPLNIDAKDLCGIFDGDNTRLFGSEPERGDVVVFRHPVSGRDYIKRLVGLPGEKIRMRDGKLVINGEVVPQVPDGAFRELMAQQGSLRNEPRCENGPVGMGGVCEKSRAIETLPNGRSYPVLNINTQISDNTLVFTVPEKHYFFVGDNRDNSLDSRFERSDGGVGFVPYENLIGRAERIIFSSSGTAMLYFWKWRSDRYFKRIE